MVKEYGEGIGRTEIEADYAARAKRTALARKSDNEDRMADGHVAADYDDERVDDRHAARAERMALIQRANNETRVAPIAEMSRTERENIYSNVAADHDDGRADDLRDKVDRHRARIGPWGSTRAFDAI